MKLRITLFFQAVLAAGFLLAASPSFAETAPRSPVLQKFETEGGKVDFLGHAYGLDGWLITNPKGGVMYVYTTPEGAALIGMLFAPDGTSESRKQSAAFLQRAGGSQAATPGAEKSSVTSEKFYAETEKANWIAIGDSAAPYLYMFMNVHCDHCQAFWKDLDSAVTAGKLQVRLVPFGEVQNNRDGAAALLSAEHPDQAWRDFSAGNAAALAKDKIRDGAYAKADANTALVKSWKLMGTPFTVYRRPADGAVTAIVGRPENTLLLPAEFLK